MLIDNVNTSAKFMLAHIKTLTINTSNIRRSILQRFPSSHETALREKISYECIRLLFSCGINMLHHSFRLNLIHSSPLLP